MGLQGFSGRKRIVRVQGEEMDGEKRGQARGLKKRLVAETMDWRVIG